MIERYKLALCASFLIIHLNKDKTYFSISASLYPNGSPRYQIHFGDLNLSTASNYCIIEKFYYDQRNEM